MTDQTWSQYLEALEALAQVEQKRRHALGRAVNARDSTVDQAHESAAKEQLMFDHARRDCNLARRELQALYAELGVDPPSAQRSEALGATPKLSELRGVLASIEAWAQETAPTIKSLQRTLNRLETAEQALVPVPPRTSPIRPSAEEPRKSRNTVLVAITVLCMIAIAVTAWMLH